MAGPEGAFSHSLLVYRSPEELVDAAARFLGDGVARDELVLAVVDAPKAEALWEALGGDAPGVAFLDPEDWYRSPGAVIEGFHRHLASSRPPAGVRTLGEPRWNGGSTAADREWRRIEALLNLAFADAEAHVACPYDATAVSEDVLRTALATHPWILDGDGRRPNEMYVDPVAVCRDLDQDALPRPPGASSELAFGAQAAETRRLVAEECRRCGFAPHRVEDVVLAVHELVSNAIRHGGGGGVLRAWRDGEALVCEVEDRGRGIRDPLQGYLPPAGPGTGGWGLWLARQLADLVELRSGPTGLVVRLHARP